MKKWKERILFIASFNRKGERGENAFNIIWRWKLQQESALTNWCANEHWQRMLAQYDKTTYNYADKSYLASGGKVLGKWFSHHLISDCHPNASSTQQSSFYRFKGNNKLLQQNKNTCTIQTFPSRHYTGPCCQYAVFYDSNSLTAPTVVAHKVSEWTN